MQKRELIRLSKTISHALRHQPCLYELELDDEGWVQVEALLSGLRGHRRSWRSLAEDDIVRVMEAADKQRFELRGGRIRALYGHSTSRRLAKVPAAPPKVLFHGTSPSSAELILLKGLRPMGRQYVHLSADRETAVLVRSRKAPEPVIFEIEALDAHAAGVAFYLGNEQVWLADEVPPAYLRKPASSRTAG